MIRILLTGGSGQVGSAIHSQLQEVGEVHAPDRGGFDLARPDTLVEALEQLSPDLIINPAAYTAVDRAEDEPELAFQVNSESPAVIARWAAPRNVPLIHFSTDFVFDGHGDEPWNEDSTPRPLSVYGASKLAGEASIRSAGGPHLIIRTSWVFAATGINFLRTIARLAAERKELRVVADQIGAPTSARTIANAVMQIIKPTLSDKASVTVFDRQIINVACAGQTSWHGFATAIVAGLRTRGVQLAVEHIIAIGTKDYPSKAVRPGNSRLDLSRLKDKFGVIVPIWSDALAIELDEYVSSHGG